MQYKDKNGVIHENTLIKGESAYEAYKIGGGKLTEAEFYQKIGRFATSDDVKTAIDEIDASVSELKDEIADVKVYATPEQYGAKGDGITDDSVAIQTALDNNDNVMFGNKTYIVQGVVLNRKVARMYGNNTILKRPSQDISAIDNGDICNVNGTYDVDRVSLTNMFMNKRSLAKTTPSEEFYAEGITFDGNTDGLTCSNSGVWSTSCAWMSLLLINYDKVTITSCTFNTSHQDALMIRRSRDITIDGNKFIKCGCLWDNSKGTVNAISLDTFCDGITESKMHYVVRNNYFEQTSDECMMISGAYNSVIENNVAYKNNQYFVEGLLHESTEETKLMIRNNTVDYIGDSCVNIGLADGYDVSNNNRITVIVDGNTVTNCSARNWLIYKKDRPIFGNAFCRVLVNRTDKNSEVQVLNNIVKSAIDEDMRMWCEVTSSDVTLANNDFWCCDLSNSAFEKQNQLIADNIKVEHNKFTYGGWNKGAYSNKLIGNNFLINDNTLVGRMTGFGFEVQGNSVDGDLIVKNNYFKVNKGAIGLYGANFKDVLFMNNISESNSYNQATSQEIYVGSSNPNFNSVIAGNNKINTNLIKSGYEDKVINVSGGGEADLSQIIDIETHTEIIGGGGKGSIIGFEDTDQEKNGCHFVIKNGLITITGTPSANTEFTVTQKGTPFVNGQTVWHKAFIRSGELTLGQVAYLYGSGTQFNFVMPIAFCNTTTQEQNRYKFKIGTNFGGNVSFYYMLGDTEEDVAEYVPYGSSGESETIETTVIALKDEVQIPNLKERVELAFNGDTPTANNIFASEIADTVNKTFDNSNGQSLRFAYVSDTHTYPNYDDNDSSTIQYKQTIQNMKAVNKEIPFDFLFHGGDFVNTQWLWKEHTTLDVAYQKMVHDYCNMLRDTNIPMICAVQGNHDGGFIPNASAVGTEYSSWKANYRNLGQINTNNGRVVRDDYDPFYYIDFDNLKLRCIFIATSMDSATTDWKGIQYQEATWLKRTLDSLPNDYNVLMFGHIPLNRWYTANQNAGSTEAFINIANGFCNHTTVDNSGSSLDCDFTTKQGKILAYICGHYHGDSIVLPSDSKSHLEFAEVTIASGSYLGSGVITTGDYYEASDAPTPRTYGTVSQDCWDSVVYNATDNKIYFTRFGAGSDRVLDLN